MEGIIHIVAYQPRELWIEGNKVTRMQKIKPKHESTILVVFYDDGNEEEIIEPILVEFIGQKPQEAEIVEEVEEKPPYLDDKIFAVSDEIDRIETIEVEKKREKYQHCNHNKSGFAIRFLQVARSNDIETVGQLLAVGRVKFGQFRNIGPNCSEKVSEALKNLYGIEKW